MSSPINIQNHSSSSSPTTTSSFSSNPTSPSLSKYSSSNNNSNNSISSIRSSKISMSRSSSFEYSVSTLSSSPEKGDANMSNNMKAAATTNKYFHENIPDRDLADRIMQSTTYVRSCQETIATLQERHTGTVAWTEHSGYLRKRSVSQHDNMNRLNLRFFTLAPNLTTIGMRSSMKRKRRPSALFSYYTKDPGDDKRIKPKRTFVLTRDTYVQEEGSLGFSLWNQNFEEDEEPKLIIQLKVPNDQENGNTEYRNSWIEHLNYTIRICKTKETQDSMMFITDFMGFPEAEHSIENLLETKDAMEKLQQKIIKLKRLVLLVELNNGSGGTPNAILSAENIARMRMSSVSAKTNRYSNVSSRASSTNSKRRCSLMTENMIRLSDVAINAIEDDEEDTSDVKDNDDDDLNNDMKKKMGVLDQANISQYTQAVINNQKSPNRIGKIKPGKSRRKMKNKKTIARKSESSYL